MRLSRLAARLFNTPHLIQESKLRVIEGVLCGRMGFDLEPGAVVEIPSDQPARSLLRTVEGVAVIDVFGTLVHRSTGMDAMSGLTSYTEIRAELERAAADPAVGAIVLNLDSPGGEVAGVFELADRIRAISDSKPIIGYAHDLAASAAYALACACSSVYLSQSGAVGSVGVVMAHVDQSAYDAKQGVKVTHIYAGARKVDGNPHEPLQAEALATMQGEIDQLYGIFVGKVAGFRGIPESSVRATEAKVYIGEEAVRAGLADGVLSSDEVLELAMNGGIMPKARLEGADDQEAEKVAAVPPMHEDEEDEEEDAKQAATPPADVLHAIRAEGALAERQRIVGLLGLVKRPADMAAAMTAIHAGETRGDLAERLLSSYQDAQAKHRQNVAADMQATSEIPTAPGPAPVSRSVVSNGPTAETPAFAKAGDEEKYIVDTCTAAWERDPALRARFPERMGGLKSLIALNKSFARGGTVSGVRCLERAG